MTLPDLHRHALLAAALLLTAAGARAGDVGPEVAKRLLSEGRIKPLSDIVAAVNAKVPGEMLEVELELEDGSYVYELKLLRPDGRVQEVEADAATAKILKIEDDD
jgi:uncharacterized membrane protein YkoI